MPPPGDYSLKMTGESYRLFCMLAALRCGAHFLHVQNLLLFNPIGAENFAKLEASVSKADI